MTIEAIKYFVKRVAYFGFKNECPFCGHKFCGFRPCGYNFSVLKEKKVVGTGLRLAACPFCHSSDRERLVYLFLKRKTNLFNEKSKLLHVAPEKNLSIKLRESSNIDYLSADLNSPLAMEKMDITKIKYPSAYFDAIICNHVLEHIIDDAKAIGELCRVLKPNGWAILQVPVSLTLDKTFEDNSILDFETREKAFGQGDHVRIYAADYCNRLKNAGFNVTVFDFVVEYGEPEEMKYGLCGDEKLYYCVKTE